MDSTLPPTPPSEAVNTIDTAKMASTSASTTNNTTTSSASQETKYIWVITGPAGCGKTSVAEHLHPKYDLPYLEGDSFHTPENIAKMAAGQPLTDADRWDWLCLLREESLSTLLGPHPTATLTQKPTDSTSSPNTPLPSGVILTCSALKRKYRDVLRIATYHHPNIKVRFVFLQAGEAELMDRVRARKGHYMKDYMVRSQFQSLEAPMGDEGDVMRVDAGGTSEEVRLLAQGVVERALADGEA